MQIIKNPVTEVNQILESFQKGFAQQVVDVIGRIYSAETVVKLLSSQLDVDRIDYLLRDSLLTGAGYGKFDLEWLLHTITIGTIEGIPEVGIDYDKGVSIAEDFVMARYYMYKHVYFHKATRGMQIIAKKVFERVKYLIRRNGGIECPEHFNVLTLSTTGESKEMQRFLPAYLELDDGVLWHWFHKWEKSDDPYLSDLSGRILHRRLLKSIDVSSLKVNQLIEIVGTIRDEAASMGKYLTHYIEVDAPSTSSYSDPYLSKRSGINKGKKNKSEEYADIGENKKEQTEASEHIFLFDRHKRWHDLARVSPIINAIREQRLEHQRLYYPEKLHKIVCKLI